MTAQDNFILVPLPNVYFHVGTWFVLKRISVSYVD